VDRFSMSQTRKRSESLAIVLAAKTRSVRGAASYPNYPPSPETPGEMCRIPASLGERATLEAIPPGVGVVPKDVEQSPRQTRASTIYDGPIDAPPPRHGNEQATATVREEVEIETFVEDTGRPAPYWSEGKRPRG